jgi:hypothetical protein
MLSEITNGGPFKPHSNNWWQKRDLLKRLYSEDAHNIGVSEFVTKYQT